MYVFLELERRHDGPTGTLDRDNTSKLLGNDLDFHSVITGSVIEAVPRSIAYLNQRKPGYGRSADRCCYTTPHESSPPWGNGTIIFTQQSGCNGMVLKIFFSSNSWSLEAAAAIVAHERRIRPSPRRLCILRATFAAGQQHHHTSRLGIGRNATERIATCTYIRRRRRRTYYLHSTKRAPTPRGRRRNNINNNENNNEIRINDSGEKKKTTTVKNRADTAAASC